MFCVLLQVFSECTLSNIILTQTNTGKQVNGKPEYEVSVSNNCNCRQDFVRVYCPAWNTVEEVDPLIFGMIGEDICEVKNGGFISQNESVKFKYASDTQNTLVVDSSKIQC